MIGNATVPDKGQPQDGGENKPQCSALVRATLTVGEKAGLRQGVIAQVAKFHFWKPLL